MKKGFAVYNCKWFFPHFLFTFKLTAMAEKIKTNNFQWWIWRFFILGVMNKFIRKYRVVIPNFEDSNFNPVNCECLKFLLVIIGWQSIYQHQMYIEILLCDVHSNNLKKKSTMLKEAQTFFSLFEVISIHAGRLIVGMRKRLQFAQ